MNGHPLKLKVGGQEKAKSHILSNLPHAMTYYTYVALYRCCIINPDPKDGVDKSFISTIYCSRPSS